MKHLSAPPDSEQSPRRARDALLRRGPQLRDTSPSAGKRHTAVRDRLTVRVGQGAGRGEAEASASQAAIRRPGDRGSLVPLASPNSGTCAWSSAGRRTRTPARERGWHGGSGGTDGQGQRPDDPVRAPSATRSPASAVGLSSCVSRWVLPKGGGFCRLWPKLLRQMLLREPFSTTTNSYLCRHLKNTVAHLKHFY